MSEEAKQEACASTVISSSGWISPNAAAEMVGYVALASTKSSTVRFRNSHGGTIIWKDGSASTTDSEGGAARLGLAYGIRFPSGIYASLTNVPVLSVSYVTE